MDPIKKQHILINCNSLDLSQLIAIIETGAITAEEFSSAGLNSEMLGALQIQFVYRQPYDELVTAIQTKKISLDDLLESDLDAESKKALKLKFCNSFNATELFEFVKSQEISLNELRDANLKEQLYNVVFEMMSRPDPVEDRKNKLKDVLNGNANAFEIRTEINNKIFTFDELKTAGLKDDVINSLKHFCDKENHMIYYEIKDLPPMENDRMDVLFIGMPTSGKSTMLAGISSVADQSGIRIPETKNIAGSKYQNKLIYDLDAGVLPEGTAMGSYNYIPLAFKNKENGNKHPFNIIEVPGENYVKMNEDGEANEFLNYLEKTANQKILIFVIDAVKKGKQGLVYVNILNMFKSRGILNKTDAIYLIVNKFDLLKDQEYKNDNRADELIAYDYLKENYLGLINNCIDARDEGNKKFKIKIMPYSIGRISHCYILNNFNKQYSNTLLNHLMHDSFIVSTNKWAKNFN